jgi:hypothetical protein
VARTGGKSGSLSALVSAGWIFKRERKRDSAVTASAAKIRVMTK